MATNSFDVNASYFRGKERGFNVARNRLNSNTKAKEERLNSKTECGANDPTPKLAINNIIDEQRQ